MTTLDTQVGGHVLFCDDIRQEASGKLILIGVYSGEMQIVARPPVTIGPLNLMIYFKEPSELNVSDSEAGFSPSSIVIRVSLSNKSGEEELLNADIELPPSQPEMWSDLSFDPDIIRARKITTHMRLNSLQIQEQSWLKVRVIRGGTVYRLGVLRITPVEHAPSPNEA